MLKKKIKGEKLILNSVEVQCDSKDLPRAVTLEELEICRLLYLLIFLCILLAEHQNVLFNGDSISSHRRGGLLRKCVSY